MTMDDVMPDFSDLELPVRQRQFEQLKLRYKVRRSVDFPVGIRIDELSVRDEIVDHLLGIIEARVIVEKLDPFVIKRHRTVYIQVPRTWWDHFKSTYKGKWWMCFRIVRYKTITREVEFTTVVRPMMAFPHNTIEYPKLLGRPVRIFEIDDFQKEREVKDDNL